MKKLSTLIIIFSLGILLSSCSSQKKEIVNKSDKQVQSNGPSKFLDSYTKADWLNHLDETDWEEITQETGTYSYNFKSDKDGIKKTVSYKKNSNNEYQGVMEITFGDDQASYILEIPKTFASHIDQLDFSVEPSSVINPDPIVEFAKTDKQIEIKSLEAKAEDDIENSLEKQIIETESKRCEKLENDKMLACALSLISKYRDSEYMEEELKNMNMAEFMGGVSQAVRQSNLRICDYIDNGDDKSLCYEYAYQTLIKDCDDLSDKAYRTCVRDLSSTLPSFKEQRLFCAYIKDEDMRAECQGTAAMEICNEIEDEERKNMCKINIVRTNNDINSCEDIDDNNYKQACIGIVGIGLNNTLYCDKVEDDYMSGLCRMKIAMKNNDQAICNPIKDSGAKDLCLANFLTKKDSITQELCNSFHELFLKETCELGLAVINNNPSKCADNKIISYDNQPICYFGIAIKHDNIEICEKIHDEKLKEDCKNIVNKKLNSEDNTAEQSQSEKNQALLSSYPPVPDWMDCRVPENVVLKNIGGGQTSGYYYYSSKTRGKVGPHMVWWGPNFDNPYQFICYNADGEKNGPYKKWNQGSEYLSEEGFYKNGKYHGVIKNYSNNQLRLLTTYEEGKKTGYAEQYCTTTERRCEPGLILRSGNYVNGRKNGFWNTYNLGVLEFKEEYIDGEVTRDESGKNIKYY